MSTKRQRVMLEQKTREIADVVKKHLPLGVGFCLVLADFGEKGNVAYVSSVERKAVAELLVELLKHWGRGEANQDDVEAKS